MASQPHVVVIGAGIVGVNVADELVSRGWTNITVVEQGPLHLPGGSSSLGDQLVFQVGSSKNLTAFARYTREKLLSLEQDGEPCYHEVGGLDVATTAPQLDELKRAKGWAASWGVPARLLTTEECVEMYPHLNKDSIHGGLHVPSDGVVRTTRAVQLLIARTSEKGVQYHGNTPVIGVEREDNRVTGVVTPSGTINADIVISCAGFWGGEIGKMLDLSVPLLPLAHQYVKTTTIPALSSGDADQTPKDLPILRFQDRDLFIRTHGQQFEIGYYGHRAMPVEAADLEIPKKIDEQHMPARLPFTQEDFDPGWQLSKDLLPALHESEISEGLNGVFSFTPDALPLIGLPPLLDNFYVAEGVWTAHSAGVARAVAELLTEGRSRLDILDFHLSRFNEVQLASSYIKEGGQEGLVGVYDVKHPLEPRESARNLRVSPFFARQRELGAYFLEWDAWEYPTWYESNAKLLEGIPSSWLPPQGDVQSSEFYSPIVAVEAWKTRTAVAMYDMTLLPRIEVSGPGAEELLQHMTTGDVSKKPGAITFGLLLDEHGGIHSDITVARLEKNLFQVGGNTPLDFVNLQREARRQMAESPSKYVNIRETTSGTCCIGLWGPYSRDVLTKVSAEDFSNKGLRFFRTKRAIVAGIPVTVMRISYVGELGWEIYTTADFGLRLWDTLWKAGEEFGVIAAGRVAFNSLRMEKGFKYCGFDMHSEHNPYEASMSFAIKKGKKGFIGQEAIERLSQQPMARRIRCLTINDGRSMVMGNEPVYLKGEVAGYVTSAAYGYTVGKPIAFTYLPSEVEEGESVDIEFFGERVAATVTAEPLFDPEMTRLRDTSSRPAALLN